MAIHHRGRPDREPMTIHHRGRPDRGAAVQREESEMSRSRCALAGRSAQARRFRLVNAMAGLGGVGLIGRGRLLAH